MLPLPINDATNIPGAADFNGDLARIDARWNGLDETERRAMAAALENHKATVLLDGPMHLFDVNKLLMQGPLTPAIRAYHRIAMAFIKRYWPAVNPTFRAYLQAMERYYHAILTPESDVLKRRANLYRLELHRVEKTMIDEFNELMKQQDKAIRGER